MIKKYQNELILAAVFIGFISVFYYLYGILLPFVFGMLLAFSAYPVILRIQKVVKNQNLATTLFLAAIVGILVLLSLFLTQYVNRDFKRLNHSFKVLTSNNQEKLDGAAQKVKEYVGSIYDFDALKKSLIHQTDSLTSELKQMDYAQLDTESIKAGFEQVLSVFQSGEESAPEKKTGIGFMAMFISTLAYFVLILYQLDYFTGIRKKYFGGKAESKLHVILDDFNQSFLKYLKLRTKIVLLLSFIYLTAFVILQMPGLIVVMVIIIVLSYIPYLQYLALIPLSIGCLVLSVENSEPFLMYFGIVVGVFVLASLLEELVLNPRIMEKNIGMNPVIVVLAVSVWSYVLGWPGLLIGVPVTSLLINYLKRFVLPSYLKVMK